MKSQKLGLRVCVWILTDKENYILYLFATAVEHECCITGASPQ